MANSTLIIRNAKDVVEAVNSGAVRGGNEMAIIFIALGGIFIDAYDFTAVAFGLKDISITFGLSGWGEGIVAASIMVGALIGAIFGGYLVDRIGRYKMFMADMLFFVGAAIGCAFAWNVESLTIFRFLMGLGIGLDFPVALAFIAEYSRRKGKGGRVTLWQPMWYIATGSSFVGAASVVLSGSRLRARHPLALGGGVRRRARAHRSRGPAAVHGGVGLMGGQPG